MNDFNFFNLQCRPKNFRPSITKPAFLLLDWYNSWCNVINMTTSVNTVIRL